MDPNWRGPPPPPPPSGVTYFHTSQLHPVQDRPGQRVSPGGSPMELDPTSAAESGAVPCQAGLGPILGFQGQGHQFVDQSHGVFGYGPFLHQPQGRPVMGMSRPPELSNDVVPDCPDFVDQNMTLVSASAGAAGSQYPYPYVPGNLVFVPQVGSNPVQYPVGTQILPQDPAGVHQMMPGPPLVMDRIPGVGLVARVPYSSVPMVNAVHPNPSGQPVLAAVPRQDAAQGMNKRMELQGPRLGKTASVRWSPHKVRMEDSARQRGHSGHSGLHNVGVNSATDLQNPSVTMGQNDTPQPSWMQEQQQQRPPSVQAPPIARPLPTYQQPNRPTHQIRHPAPPRSSAAPVVRTGESTRGSGGSESVVQREKGRERRQSSDPHRTVEPSDEADISSLRVFHEEEPSPMETGTPPELSDVKLPSLLNVHIRKKGVKERMRDLVHQFVASTYRDLWHRTYCVPQKSPVSQHHPDKALVRTREGEFRVSLALELMSIHKEEHMFVLGDYHYEGFLHHLSPAQVDVTDEGLVTQLLGQLRKEQQFGDFDLLLFHPQCGLMVVGLCSVNSNSDVQYILKRVQKARNQLDRSVAVAKRYVETLDLHCPVTRVFCTPNLKRPFLAKVTGRDRHTDRALQAANVLCSEQLPAQFRTQWLTAQSFSVLLNWWAEVKSKEQKVAGQLSLEDLTLLLGCFLCPSLSKVDFDQTSPMPPSESRPLIQAVSGDASSPSVTAQKRESSESPHRESNTSISNLYLSIGSLTKSFTQYMDEYVDLYFPHHLSRTYRVPPIHFNIQKIDKKGSYDILDAPMSKDMRGDEGENRVVSAIEILSMKYEAVRPVFIICDFQYNHYLNKLKESMFVKGDDRRPRRAFGQSVRAQHDCLLIHRRHGVIIISVKAVGDNFDTWASSGSDKLTAVQRTLAKGLKQLPREEAMVKMVLDDLTSDLPCTKLIALPNLSRQDVDAAVDDDDDLKQGIQAMFPAYGTQAFLCKDELCEAEENIWEAYEQRPDFLSRLISWWDRSVGKGKDNVLSKQLYKQIIGRFCGLLSTVEIWSTHTPRIEVRNLGEAVQETGERYSRILLTQEQLKVLHQPSRLVYLSGPPGTGKTMLLVLQAQRWVEEGHQVVILNLYYGSAGLPLGHLLQRQVMQRVQASSHNLHPQDSKDGGGGQFRSPHRHHAASSSSSAPAQSAASSARSTPTPSARVRRIDFDNRVFDENKPGKLAEIPEGAYIVVDEITQLSHPVLSWVVERRKPQALWCAGQFEERCPEGFEPSVLNRILRCPPTVQRVLQHTSYDLGSVGKETRAAQDLTRKANYVLSSAPYGLATDGARPRFIFHSGHHSPSPSPLACSKCGQELAELLTHHLHLQHSTYDLAKDRKLGPLPMSGGSLSLKDVVIISKQVEPCALITALKKRGLTVSVVTGTANPMVAVPTHETIVFTTPPAMTGLERKVVVYVPFQSRDVLEEEEKDGGEGGKERKDVLTDDLRVRQVLGQLTPDDRVLLWYTASRCLSQLIVVVP